MGFEALKTNEPTTLEQFLREGCMSVNNETGDRCGCKRGYARMRGPEYQVFVCANCGVGNTIYRDEETLKRCKSQGIGETAEGSFIFSLDLEKQPPEGDDVNEQ